MHLRSLTPSISALLAFDAAARHENFTKAGLELSLSQSAVSRHVQALESMLQAVLFERSGHTIKLTAEGALYAREVGDALLRIRRASMQVYGSRGRENVLQLAVLPIFASKWLMPRLDGFYQKYPDALIDIHARHDEFDLEMSGMDACITMGDGKWSRMDILHLVDARGIVVISPSLLKKRAIQHPSDLLRQNLLQITSHFSLWNDCLLENGLDPRKAILGAKYEYTEHLIQACERGLGVGLVSDIFVQEELKQGSLVSPEIQEFKGPRKNYYLIHPVGSSRHPTLFLFKQWLEEELGPDAQTTD